MKKIGIKKGTPNESFRMRKSNRGVKSKGPSHSLHPILRARRKATNPLFGKEFIGERKFDVPPLSFEDVVADAPSWFVDQYSKQTPEMQKQWSGALKFLTEHGTGDRESYEASYQKQKNRRKLLESTRLRSLSDFGRSKDPRHFGAGQRESEGAPLLRSSLLTKGIGLRT